MADTLVKVRADRKQNRLHITIAGKVDLHSLEQLYTDIRFCIAELNPGFEVINDLSRCQLIYITSLPTYKKIIDFLLSHNAGQIVRIVEEHAVSYKQIHSFTDQISCYQPLYVHSSQEAEQRLEEIRPRAGIRLKLRHLKLVYDSAVGSGEADINDISTSGCAVTKATLILPEQMDFEGFIAFPPHPPLIGHVQMKARVVRCSDTGFAAKFLDVSDEFREKLYQRFLHEAGRSSFAGG
nr:PilZ domain-containing protein [uncultured Desulfobulbus sp.]